MIIKNEKLFQKMVAMKERLMAELKDYDQAVLNLPEKPGAWSVMGCLHHLYITEWGTGQYIRKKTQKPELIPPYSIVAALKLQALRYSFGTGIKFKAPSSLPQPPDGLTIEGLDKDWSKVRASIRELMDTLTEDLQEKGIFRHPIAGRINMTQTLDFFIFHFERHEGQIRRVLKAVAK
ncbi:MAG: DinB family protein [Cyclobacteriaceae bacterium]